MIRLLVSALALSLAIGCQAGDFGNLEPLIEGTTEKGEQPHSAVVRAGEVSATLSARWASEASQSAEIRYVNQGKAPVSIALSRLVLRHPRLGEAALWTASDMTGIDRKTNNQDAPIIYNLDDAAAQATQLIVKPGEPRFLSIGFTNYPGTERIRKGDRVVMTVPLGSTQDAKIQFDAE
jgi:hypothetical protein